MFPWIFPKTVLIFQSEQFSEKSIQNFTDSGYPSNFRRNTYKKSRGKIIVRRFLQGIWFYV